MNLMEKKDRSRKQDWREDIRSDQNKERKEEDDDLMVEDLDEEEEETFEENESGINGLLQRPYMTTVLLGVIVLLLLCIIILLVLMPRQKEASDANGNLQQNITEYAQEQKQNDVQNVSGEDIVVQIPDKEEENKQNASVSGQESTGKKPQTEKMPESDQFVSADGDKTAVVVDIEDENDAAYTKEYILNEALPYFADNNQDAIWDLAHLKRYVKLSSSLEGTDQYYYTGAVNGNGRPEGKGLAIYEKNSYYYGSWSDGKRSGEGIWFRFYIGQRAEHYDVDISKLQVRERILQNIVGNFSDGLYDGELYANTVDYTGNVEEWSGITSRGVFTLWRDMSAIGECSVWRKNDDHSLCMDIDKSENKNQGIRELLKKENK